MTTNDISFFQEIVKYGSISKAAEALYVTQPTLSQHIRALEKELNVTLIERRRGSKQIVLTPMGQKLALQANKWDRLWSETMAIMSQPFEQILTIAASMSISSYVIQYALFDFINRQAELETPIQAKLLTPVYSEAMAALEAGKIDFAFYSMIEPSELLSTTPLYIEPFVFVCAKGSHYPATVHASSLNPDHELFIGRSGKAFYTAELSDWHRKQFGQQTPRYTTVSTPYLSNYFTEPDIWAILPISIAKPYLEKDHIETRTCHDFPQSRTIYMLHNADIPLTPLYDFFIKDVYKYLARYDEFTIL